MSLPMAPDVDLATVPLIPVSPLFEEEDPGTEEEQAPDAPAFILSKNPSMP
jgi:hypothetical protein